jgi:hypothetical protein
MTIPNSLEIASLFFIPLFAVLVPILIGQRYGMYRLKKTPDSKDTQVGSLASAALGLLAFMLAFTFQIAANRFDARKQKLIEEVTSLRTTYLRAGLVPEPYRLNTKKLVVEYVDLAADFGGDYSKLNQALSRSQQILDTLWKYSEALAEQDRSSEAYALYTSSVNDLVDAHHQRITYALEYRIPVAILWVLFIVEFLSMLAFGYQFGISGKGSFRLNLLLATIFATVMFLIFALDRPEKGLAPLSQKPMLSLQRQLQEHN